MMASIFFIVPLNLPWDARRRLKPRAPVRRPLMTVALPKHALCQSFGRKFLPVLQPVTTRLQKLAAFAPAALRNLQACCIRIKQNSWATFGSLAGRHRLNGCGSKSRAADFG